MLKARGNTHVYIKPSGSPSAFVAGDKVANLTGLTPNVNNQPIETDTYDQAAASRMYGANQASFQFSHYFAPGHVGMGRLVSAFQAQTFVDALVVWGTTPQGGAQNLAMWGKFMVSQPPIPQGDIGSMLVANVACELADGTSLNVALNLTSFPTI